MIRESDARVQHTHTACDDRHQKEYQLHATALPLCAILDFFPPSEHVTMHHGIASQLIAIEFGAFLF